MSNRETVKIRSFMNGFYRTFTFVFALISLCSCEKYRIYHITCVGGEVEISVPKEFQMYKIENEFNSTYEYWISDQSLDIVQHCVNEDSISSSSKFFCQVAVLESQINFLDTVKVVSLTRNVFKSLFFVDQKNIKAYPLNNHSLLIKGDSKAIYYKNIERVGLVVFYYNRHDYFEYIQNISVTTSHFKKHMEIR